MFKRMIRHHRTLGDEDVLPDCLTGGLFDGIFPGSVGDFFKKLKEMWWSNYVDYGKRSEGWSWSIFVKSIKQ